jgi:hypothetical protein
MLSEVAFVGGATVCLYVDSIAASDVRATEDVDCVIELAGYHQLPDTEARLRKLGFANAHSKGEPICRWLYKGIKVDVMPTDGKIFGFSNRWYKEG